MKIIAIIFTLIICGCQRAVSYVEYNLATPDISFEIPNVGIKDLTHYTRKSGGESLVVISYSSETAVLWFDCCPNQTDEVDKISSAWKIKEGQWVRNGKNMAYMKRGERYTVIDYAYGEQYKDVEDNLFYRKFNPNSIKFGL